MSAIDTLLSYAKSIRDLPETTKQTIKNTKDIQNIEIRLQAIETLSGQLGNWKNRTTKDLLIMKGKIEIIKEILENILLFQKAQLDINNAETFRKNAIRQLNLNLTLVNKELGKREA